MNDPLNRHQRRAAKYRPESQDIESGATAPFDASASYQAAAKPSLYRTPEAAEYLRMAESTLRKMRCSGSGPRYCKLGKVVAYHPDDLDAWLDANRRLSTSVAA